MRVRIFVATVLAGVTLAAAASDAAPYAGPKVTFAPRGAAAQRPPRIAPAPGTVKPLDAPTLKGAKAAVLNQYNHPLPKPANALTAPLTVDTAHVKATLGQVTARLTLFGVAFVSVDMASFSGGKDTVTLDYRGLDASVPYLLDCSVFGADGKSIQIAHYAPIYGTTAPAEVSNGHMLYGFELSRNDDILFDLSGFPPSSILLGCTLHPAAG
jgi:hypothetical protein